MDILVLIETLWNVNEQIHNGPLHVRNIVLIETLWNVNRDFGIVLLRSVHRINRNIVECKSMISVSNAFREKRINRNIVECKF